MTHVARKRFGQNFLHDPLVIRRILESIRPQPGDRLVEIGPGQGAITRGLLQAAGRLIAIELDRDLIDPLKSGCATFGDLEVIGADALKFDFSALAINGAKLRLVGNLPYNISTPILFHLLTYAAVIRDMHFMLQKEVVERMAAEPGGKVYGRLSVMLQAQCRVEHLFDVGPGAFRPAPKVDSSVVRLTPHAEPPVVISDYDRFAALVAQAFSQRRKTLRKSLQGMLTAEAIEGAGIDPMERPEQLSLAQFAALAGAACNSPE